MILKSATDIKILLSGKREIAFIDVREAAQYGAGHPFFVSHVPYSILESHILDYVPCLKTALVIIDDNDGVAGRAARHLEEMGYSNILILEGGVPAWKAAGYVLYEGISVPSKSFGEVVEHELGTISITAEQLKARMDRGDDDFIILDGRTPSQYNEMTIPTSVSCPNAELSLRYMALLDNPEQDIIVNCAGRTRSLIGAESLRTLNIPNKVYALENGTMGWTLAGFELEYGATRSFPTNLSDSIIEEAQSNADQLTRKYALDVINNVTLENWQNDQTCTTFLFDVRTAEEYNEGHIKGARHAPGGQLIQATDQWFATRNARIVLFDNHKIRAVMTAIWLQGMGHDAYILYQADLIKDEPDEKRYSNAKIINIGEMSAKIYDGVGLLDVRSSQDYRTGHIEGAIWGIRPKLTPMQDVIIIADDLIVADLVAKDMGGDVSISLSTTEEWQRLGLKVVASPNDPPDEERIDFLFHTHDRHSGNMDAAREYLRWETGLLDQMDDQERATLKPLYFNN